VLGAIVTTAGVGHEPIQIYPNDNWDPQTWCFDWNRSSRIVKGKLENSNVFLKFQVKCLTECLEPRSSTLERTIKAVEENETAGHASCSLSFRDAALEN
jgi:hypothetical protein